MTMTGLESSVWSKHELLCSLLSLKLTSLGHVVGDEFSKLRLRECQSKKELENIKKDVASKKALDDETKLLKENLASHEKDAKEREEFFKKNLEELEADRKVRIGKVQEDADVTMVKSVESVNKVVSEGKSVEMLSSGEDYRDVTLVQAEGGGDVSKDYKLLSLGILSWFPYYIFVVLLLD